MELRTPLCEAAHYPYPKLSPSIQPMKDYTLLSEIQHCWVSELLSFPCIPRADSSMHAYVLLLFLVLYMIHGMVLK